MFIEVHTDFIFTSLMEVLKDGVDACTSMPVGIENSALGEYFMQSLFLRMTGAQEQKLKCICWVMATNDYQYRYELLNVKQYGECSEYKDKRDIYRDMLTIIRRMDKAFKPLSILDDVKLTEVKMSELETSWKLSVDKKRQKQEKDIINKVTSRGQEMSEEAKARLHENLFGKAYPQEDLDSLISRERKALFLKDVVARLVELVGHSPLTMWNQREFLFFKDHWQDILNVKQLPLTDKELLGSGLQDDYNKIVFEHRNRTAHNTVSYLKDVPTLDVLADTYYVYRNYFFRFAILLVIDKVFVEIFRKYREAYV